MKKPVSKKIRVITAAARFDGHDVSINIFRRLLVKEGLEVIHLGHDRSVQELVKAAIEEDVDALLVSSYQGGHNEYFRYLIDLLKQNNAAHILVFGGGGGVIKPDEIVSLQEYGVEKIFHATEGRNLGMQGMAKDIVARISARIENRVLHDIEGKVPGISGTIQASDRYFIGRYLSLLEEAPAPGFLPVGKDNSMPDKTTVIGITGTGGSGKSSLTDELVSRFLKTSGDVTIAVLAVDPTKSVSGGALLGDRIRICCVDNDRVFMRSFATRTSPSELGENISDAISFLKGVGFDLIFVETSGIGQGDSAIVEISDISMYVMTSEFGAPSQLDKINMLDHADFIVVNKNDKLGSEDALREVRLHQVRNQESGPQHGVSLADLDLPVYGTNANRFNDPGINRLFVDLFVWLFEKLGKSSFSVEKEYLKLLPLGADTSYAGCLETGSLARIADTLKAYHLKAEEEADLADSCYCLKNTINLLKKLDKKSAVGELAGIYESYWSKLDGDCRKFINSWPKLKESYGRDIIKYNIGSKEIEVETHSISLSGSKIPKVALPGYRSWRELVMFYYKENLPGRFPFTAGLYPFRNRDEKPRRQFAGVGGPRRTNERLHYLTEGDQFKRLSIAFDGITLYGGDPGSLPDVYGKIGESGVCLSTIEDMRELFKGFYLADPATSVSMTINGPAPVMLAFYFKVALEQEEEKRGTKLSENEKIILFRRLRGTVQADILKEDQGQNTCIFSIDFALRLMADVQKYFSKHKIRNYYSISVSGYHIAEAGANPVTQLAFTLANGFYYVEYFLSCGLHIDDFAENLSFFFSCGMDPEYSVIGRVARRIWSIVMRNRYSASPRGEKLKYHIQTSGRSLHAMNIDYNDIRTTLQALLAFYDNCNSLHTNAFDEAVTTPTEESVRRAMAIQLILSREFGMLENENPNQGTFIIEELTDLVEKAVLDEFYRISHSGGVIGAMEKQYQRSKIQEESLYYEQMRENGHVPIIGVNTFYDESSAEEPCHDYGNMELSRASREEKDQILENHERFKKGAGEKSRAALDSLKRAVISGDNIFEELLNTVEYATLGEITSLFYEVGGKYRRNM